MVSFVDFFACLLINHFNFNDFLRLCQIFLRKSYFDKKIAKKFDLCAKLRYTSINKHDSWIGYRSWLIRPGTQIGIDFRRIFIEKSRLV